MLSLGPRCIALCFTTVLLSGRTSWAIAAESEPRLQIAVELNEAKGDFTVTLKNPGSEAKRYIDGLGRYAGFGGSVPADTVILLRSGSGIRVPIPEDLISKGYTSLISESKIYTLPLEEAIIKPGEEIKKTFAVSKLAEGISRAAGMKAADLEKCQLRILIRVFLDGNLSSWIEGVSDWTDAAPMLKVRKGEAR
jgi:hypothetical protein